MTTTTTPTDTTLSVPVTGSATETAQTITVPGQSITVTIPAQTITIPAQTVKVSISPEPVTVPASTLAITGTAAIPVTTDLSSLATAVAALLNSTTTTPITPTTPPTIFSISITSVANVEAIGAAGVKVTNNGIDGSSFVYAQSLVGKTVTFSGITFTLGTPNTLNAVSSSTIPVSVTGAFAFSKLIMLGTAVNGNQGNQSFTITYTDGTTSVITQSLSDWFTYQNYINETVAVTMADRYSSTGALSAGPLNIYGYSLPINSAKVVKSITLPANRNVVILALSLST